MKTLRFCSCVLLAGLLLLLSSSCEQSKIHPGVFPADKTVNIAGCKASPDPVTVKTGKTVQWVINDPSPNPPSYIIDFHGKDPTASPFLVNSTVGDIPHKVLASSGCSSANPSGCDYKYSLTTYTGSSTTQCADPVLHVDP